MDGPDLSRIAVRALAWKRRCADDRETRGNVVLGVQLKDPLGVLEFEFPQVTASARNARLIETPLGIVVPEEQQRSLAPWHQIHRCAAPSSGRTTA
jgi:hypothetical protein